jgi:hypothetical protein
MMLRNFTLPDLQEKLDGLNEGSLVEISSRDFERLFGTNDVAATRLRNFAKSHSCVITHVNDAILFRKQFAGVQS